MDDTVSNYFKSKAEYDTGKIEVLEEMAIAMMIEFAGTFRSEMIATSFYDVRNWGKLSEKDREAAFWRRYLELQKESVKRIRNQLINRILEKQSLTNEGATRSYDEISEEVDKKIKEHPIAREFS